MYITSQTGTVVAILTRAGRQLMADNSAGFTISKWAFSDDDINYAQYDGSSINAVNGQIANTPILEPCTNNTANAAQRFQLLSLQQGITNISYITTNIINNATYTLNTQNVIIAPAGLVNIIQNYVTLNQRIPLNILTNFGYDTNYNLYIDNTNVISLDSNFVYSTKDPNMENLLQKQSYATTNIIFKGIGTANLTIVGTNSKSTYKNKITVVGFNPPTQTVNPNVVIVGPGAGGATNFGTI